MSHKKARKAKKQRELKKKSLSVVGVFFLIFGVFLLTMVNVSSVISDDGFVSYYEVDADINFDDYDPNIDYQTGIYALADYDDSSSNNALLSSAAIKNDNSIEKVTAIYNKYDLNILKYQYHYVRDIDYLRTGRISSAAMDDRVKLLAIKQKSRAKASITALYSDLGIEQSEGDYEGNILSLFKGEQSLSNIKTKLMPPIIVEEVYISEELKVELIDNELPIEEELEKPVVQKVESKKSVVKKADSDCKVYIEGVAFGLEPCHIEEEMNDLAGDKELNFSINSSVDQAYSYAIYGYGVGFPKYGIYGGDQSGLVDGVANISKYFNDEILKEGIYEGYLKVAVRSGVEEKELNLFVNLNVGGQLKNEVNTCTWKAVAQDASGELDGECPCGEEFSGYICSQG